jgi:hypothetical protein
VAPQNEKGKPFNCAKSRQVLMESTNDTKDTKYRSADVISKLSNDYNLNSPIEPQNTIRAPNRPAAPVQKKSSHSNSSDEDPSHDYTKSKKGGNLKRKKSYDG